MEGPPMLVRKMYEAFEALKPLSFAEALKLLTP